MASSLTPEQIDKLAAVAGKRLGTTPEQLKALFQEKGLAGLVALTRQEGTAALSPEETAAATQLLQNKDKAAQLLNDPRVQSVLRRFISDK